MRELIAVILLLMIFTSGKADEPIWDVSTNTQYEAQVYYVNPDGGTRYHTRRDCPSMSEKYYNGVVAYTVDELPQGLKACPFCGAPEVTTPTLEVQQVYYVNSRGGKKYHIRKKCYSIDEEYYNDMEAYTVDTLPQGLKPCTACGATAVATPTPEPPKVYYFVNPEGGTRYHTRRDCPSISEKYHNGMVAYPLDELPQGLVECQICKDDASQQTNAPQATLSAGTYIVGVDIPQGLYNFIGDENADGVLTICAWDGCVEKSWQGTANLSNEQTLKLPQGCQAVWHLALATSEYDTGARNLRLNEAGIYQEGRDLAAGLYIVQNNGNATTTVSLLNSADGTLLQSWSVEPGVMITLYLREAYSVQITEGCLLRSMTTKWLMQQGQQESIIHGRYSTMMQLPKREYTVIGQDDDAYVKVTNLQQNETVTYDLSKGETLQLDLRSYDRTEYLVEFMHVDVSWNKADG